jgi:tetratricopeptide (TPR) repeat protein
MRTCLGLFFCIAVNIFGQESNIDEDEFYKPDREKLISDAKVKIEITKLSAEASSLIKAKKWKEPELVVKQINDLSDVSVDYHYLKGSLHYSYGEFPMALQFLNSAIKLNNTHDPSYFLIGMVFAKKNDWEKAIPFFEKANQHGSFNPYYRINLAVAYFQNDQFEKAATESKATLELKENFTNARILYLKSAMKFNKKDAWFYLQDLIERKQDISPFYNYYIQTLFEYKKNYSEVIKELSKKNSLTLEEKKFLAFSYFKDNEPSKSYNLYKQFIGTDRDSEDDLQSFMKVLIHLGKDPEAEKILSQILKTNFERRRFHIEFYTNLLQKRDALKFLYTPIIMR